MTCKSRWVVAVGLLVGCGLIALPAVGQKQGPAGPAGLPVTVVNGSGQPVPTAAQGTTNVAGTVNVGNTPNVTVANTPNVNIANTPSVSIAGTPTVSLAAGGSVGVINPLDSQNQPTPLAVLDAVQPYEDGCTIFFHSPSLAGQCSVQTVPAGKRLVIQEFDAIGQLENGLKPVSIGFTANSENHYFPATFMGSIPSYADFFASHQGTRLYAPATVTPVCSVQLTAISNTGIYNCQISGFLVDVP